QQYCIVRFYYSDYRLEQRTVDSCGNNTCLKTPQDYSKEGRLKPFFANNVDIPFAGARRLKPCPRKATIRSGKQPSAYLAFYITTRITTTLYGGTSIYAQSQNLRKEPIKLMLHTVLVT